MEEHAILLGMPVDIIRFDVAVVAFVRFLKGRLQGVSTDDGGEPSLTLGGWFEKLRNAAKWNVDFN
eukprot:4815571-Amphidinium_carterae.1